jgi:hypothetical protein
VNAKPGPEPPLEATLNDHPTSDPGQPASTGQDSADLARLQGQYPDWDVRRGTGSDPLGYSASRDGTLITSPSLTRLADLLAGAGPEMIL